MSRMVDLHPIKADLDQLLYHRFRHDHSRMGEHGNTTQFVDQANHFCSWRPGFRHVGRSSIANEADEGLFLVHGSSGGHNGRGNVRAPHRSTIGP